MAVFTVIPSFLKGQQRILGNGEGVFQGMNGTEIKETEEYAEVQ